MPVTDTTGITSALTSGGLAGADLVTSCTSIDGTADYSYDPTGQLTGVTYPSPLPPGEGQGEGALANESYSYDANGNRTSANGSTYVTGPDNELLSDGTYTYSYDAEGNRTERVDIATGAVTSYTWDARDRLTSVTDYAGGLSQVSSDETGTVPLTPTQTVSYVYDPENRLVEETVTSAATAGSPSSVQSTYFVYDGNQIVLQFQPASVSSVPSVVDSSALPQSAGQTGPVPITGADLTHRYLWQPNAVDQVLADEHVTNPQSTGNVVWPLADNLGTVRDLAVYNAATGLTSVANHRVYDSFGNLKSQTNAAVDCLFGFTGLPSDDASGTYRTPTRAYDPVTGRWLSQDWIGFNGRDTNLYRYCGNSPTNTTDANGEFIPVVVGVVVGLWWFFTPNVANAPAPNDPVIKADPVPNPMPALAAGAAVVMGSEAAAIGYGYAYEIASYVLPILVSGPVMAYEAAKAAGTRFPGIWGAIEHFFDPAWGSSAASAAGKILSDVVWPRVQEWWQAGSGQQSPPQPPP